MDAISHVMFRKVIKYTMNRVNDDRAPILVTQANCKNVVLIRFQDFREYEAFQVARELAISNPNYRFTSRHFLCSVKG